MTVYKITYKKYNESKTCHIAARSITKAVEVGLAYLKKNESYSYEIIGIEKVLSLARVQK